MSEKILKQIKQCRIKKGLSLKELFNRTKISYNYLLMLENGKKKNPSLNTMNKIANALDVEITFLFKNN